MKMMRKNWKDRKGVSPVIATILMVAITVVLAAVLYVMVMGFGDDGGKTPTVALNSKETTTTGYYDVYVTSVSGGDIDHEDVSAIVVSGNAKISNPTTGGINHKGSETNLQAGDNVTVEVSGAGDIVVMFKDKVSGNSLGQVTIKDAKAKA